MRKCVQHIPLNVTYQWCSVGRWSLAVTEEQKCHFTAAQGTAHAIIIRHSLRYFDENLKYSVHQKERLMYRGYEIVRNDGMAVFLTVLTQS